MIQTLINFILYFFHLGKVPAMQRQGVQKIDLDNRPFSLEHVYFEVGFMVQVRYWDKSYGIEDWKRAELKINLECGLWGKNVDGDLWFRVINQTRFYDFNSLKSYRFKIYFLKNKYIIILLKIILQKQVKYEIVIILWFKMPHANRNLVTDF